MDEILIKMLASAPGIVGVIVVVILFLKFQRSNIEQIREINDKCHARTRDDREAYQKQMDNVVDRHEKLANGYTKAMTDFGAAIGTNGEILKRVEKAIWHTHRRKDDPPEEE